MQQYKPRGLYIFLGILFLLSGAIFYTSVHTVVGSAMSILCILFAVMILADAAI